MARARANSGLEDPDFQITYDRLTVNSRGALAGAQVGADWQFGNLVVGGEIDASWASIKGSLAPDPNFFLSGLSAQYQALATGTARVGYAAGNLLGYVKGGVAWANIDYKSAIATGFPVDVNHQRTGLTGGVGLEMALTGQSLGPGRIRLHLFRRGRDLAGDTASIPATSIMISTS